MSRRILACLMVTGLWSSPAICQDELDAPPPALLQDPSLATSTYFPPTLTNAGVANTGPALDSTGRSHRLACSLANPCAIPTPAADHVKPARADLAAYRTPKKD